MKNSSLVYKTLRGNVKINLSLRKIFI